MSDSNPKIGVITFIVGNDYKKAMEPGMATKRSWCLKHNYDFIEGGDEFWDRDKPIPWSKIPFLLSFLDKYDFLFVSDADVVIMNQDLKIEDVVLPYLAPGKDMLWTMDSCNHHNSGNMLLRGRSSWVRSYFEKVMKETSLTYHIWWENAAMIKVMENNYEDRVKISTLNDAYKFNAYLFSATGSTKEITNPRLYEQGDLLIHFAGVYDIWNIHRMMNYCLRCKQLKKPFDLDLLQTWRSQTVSNRKKAEESLNSVFLPIN